MGFGDVLDAAFSLLRSAFWRFALAEAIVAVPVAVMQFYLMPSRVPANFGAILATFSARAPVTLLVGVLGILQSGALVSLAELAGQGRPADVGQAYRRALLRFPELLGYGIVYGLMVGVGLALFAVPGIALAVLFSQGLFLIVLDGRGIVASFGESYRLVGGHFWRVLGIGLVAYLMITIVSLLVTALIAAVTGGGASHAFTAALTTLISILIGSFPLIALYVQYRDLRRAGSLGD